MKEERVSLSVVNTFYIWSNFLNPKNKLYKDLQQIKGILVMKVNYDILGSDDTLVEEMEMISFENIRSLYEL